MRATRGRASLGDVKISRGQVQRWDWSKGANLRFKVYIVLRCLKHG